MEKDIKLIQNLDRSKIEIAIMELTSLLVQDEILENAYQKWCEKYNFIFGILGYTRVLSKPSLPTNSTNYLEPDFMAQGVNGIWEVIDLKRPDTKILKDKSKRASFYADFNEYYEQCRDYSQFFQDSQNRKFFEQEYDTKIQRYVISTIIAGRDDGIDKVKINDKLSDKGNTVKFLTYDHIKKLLELERDKYYKKYEDNPGYSIHCVTIIRKLQNQNNYLFDFGESKKRNILSLYIDQNDNVVVQILDMEGNHYSNIFPMESLGIFYDNIVYLTIEIGLLHDCSIINVESNSGIYSEKIVNKFPFMPLYNWVIGSDIDKKEKTHMELLEHVVYVRTLKYTEKLQLHQYFNNKFHNYTIEKLPPRVKFHGHQFMYTNPKSGNNNLHADKDYQPTYLK